MEREPGQGCAPSANGLSPVLQRWPSKFQTALSSNESVLMCPPFQLRIAHPSWSQGRLVLFSEVSFCSCVHAHTCASYYYSNWWGIKFNNIIIESAEGLPILCARYARWEREIQRELERERDRERERVRWKWRHLSSAEIGDEFCTFPCQKCAP